MQRIDKGGFFPWQQITGDMEVADTVCCCTCDNQAASAGGMNISYPASGSCLCTREGSYSCWEIMRLSGKDDVIRKIVFLKPAWETRDIRNNGLNRITSDSTRIIFKSNDAVHRICL